MSSEHNDTHGVEGEGWYGFDLDGTLAKYDGWKGIDHIGEPVRPMVELIKRMHGEGKVVKIMTARVAPRENPETARTRYPLYAGDSVDDVPEYVARWMLEMRKAGRVSEQVEAYALYSKRRWTARDFIADWCLENLGFLPEIVYQKDHLMLELYDDRVKQVVPNEGWLVEDIAMSKRQRTETTIVKREFVDVRWWERINCCLFGMLLGAAILTVIIALVSKNRMPAAEKALYDAAVEYHSAHESSMVLDTVHRLVE